MGKSKSRISFRGMGPFAIGLFVAALGIGGASLLRGQGSVGGEGEAPVIHHEGGKDAAHQHFDPPPAGFRVPPND